MKNRNSIISIIIFSLCILFLSSLLASETLASLRASAKGLRSNFSANFSYTSSNGAVLSGKIYYQSPNKLHIKTSDGGVVATNGRFLWIYRPGSATCIKQEVGGHSGGIFSLLASYSSKREANTFVFKKESAFYREIRIRVNSNMLQSVTLNHEGEISSYNFSNIAVNRGIKASLFNFRAPTNVRVVENPLNK